MNDEIWLTIEGWPYEVSTFGRVRRQETKQILHMKITVQVDLHCGKGKKKTVAVHNLVAAAFLPKPPGDKHWEINHKSGDRTDNSLDNLEWMTRRENIRHYWSVLKAARSSKAVPTPISDDLVPQTYAWAKLTAEQVMEIVRLYKTGVTQSALATQFNVSWSMIGGIVNGRRWQHITGGERLGHRITGNTHKLAKLTEADIPVIRRLHSEGVSMREIGRRYNVSSQTIRQIFTGVSWKQVDVGAENQT